MLHWDIRLKFIWHKYEMQIIVNTQYWRRNKYKKSVVTKLYYKIYSVFILFLLK